MRRFLSGLAAGFAGLLVLNAQSAAWPPIWSVYGDPAAQKIDVRKTAGWEMTDHYWAHLHQGMLEASTVTFGVKSVNIQASELPVPQITDIQIRYTVHGTPVSGWLGTPFTFTLDLANPGLPALDGIHDVSIEVQGPARSKYTFVPMFLHLARGRSVSADVPVISRDVMYDDYGFTQGPGVRYIKYSDMRRVGRPADPAVTAWHGPSWQEQNLYQEELMPHTDLFMGQQMWWEEPVGGPNAGLKFARILVPKWDEDHRGLRKTVGQEKFPFVDGPRSIGWTSTYIMGQVDRQGNFCFVEAGGPLRCMGPDGAIITKVGWHVTPGKDPVWVLKTLAEVRANETFAGVFTEGRYEDGDGFRTPLDLAMDPRNDKIYYVAGYEDNAIWKADCTDFPTTPCQVSVFAGDVGHTAGFVNGAGRSARFHGPAGLVFDPICDCLYVADQDNDAVRRISRAGVVSTLFGSPGQDKRQLARGVTTTDQYAVQAANRTAAGDRYQRGPGSSTGLETYLPQALRVDSQGNLILLDIGFGAIRRINPSTLEAKHLAVVGQRFERNDEPSSGRGFASLDVDRWGNAGPLDQIYYGAFQASWCDGEAEQHPNEAYCVMPREGAPAHFLFPKDWNPYPDGWGPRERTDPPHYYWLSVVDPRGAVILGGGGEHGLTRLRKQRPTDPTLKDDNEAIRYERGKLAWRYGLAGTGPTPMLANGSECHSFLGLPDCSDLAGAGDDQLIQTFGLQAFPSDARSDLIFFMRRNMWPPPPPPPTPARK